MKKIHSNVFVGAAIALFATFVLLEARKIAEKSPQSALFPMVILGAMYLVAAFLVVTGFRSSEKVEWKIEKAGVLRVLGLFCSMIVYALLLPILGYIICTIFLLFCGLLLFGNRDIKLVVLLAIVVPICMYLAFTRLNVRLPEFQLF